ncbi:MAG: beta-propeller domain-containing protein [Xanthomonadaceae bacterium]|jgi:hypothetical protein|nr:beta-propeller domain-containing protein [Xanthomonadaceae bacterium]
MRKRMLGWLSLLLFTGCPVQERDMVGSHMGTSGNDRPLRTLPAFASEAEWEQWLKGWTARADLENRRPEVQQKQEDMPAISANMMASAESTLARRSLTNVQTAGVDEGGIVKQHGEHLVVLRRGRLFTIKIGDDALQPIATVDAFAPGNSPNEMWHDEMLIAADTVAVIGHSDARGGGIEVGLFDIDSGGRLSYRGTYHLRGNDDYSFHNYASRLIGNQLIFYMPLLIDRRSLDNDSFYPALRHWYSKDLRGDFKRILPATKIYRSAEGVDMQQDVLVLHTVTRCDLSQPRMECESTAVLGAAGHVFYVSTDSVYVWTTRHSGSGGAPNRSTVFRIPLNGTAASALKTRGAPLNSLSFLQDESGHLNVLVTAQVSQEESMCNTGRARGETALLRVSLHDFDNGTVAAKVSDYHSLPNISRDNPQHHFIGGWLIYAGEGMVDWGDDDSVGDQGAAYALRYSHEGSIQPLVLHHPVDRIEEMGSDAILVGSTDADLHFTTVHLEQRATVMGTYVQTGAVQKESHAQSFFYRSQQGRESIIGLPIVTKMFDGAGNYSGQSAVMLYLRNEGLQLSSLGRLVASIESVANDNCQISCVDWYGDTQPLFVGSRIFALLGYELVEGAFDNNTIRERRRANFMPKTLPNVSE